MLRISNIKSSALPGGDLLGLGPPFDAGGGVMAMGVSLGEGKRMRSMETGEGMVVEGKRRWLAIILTCQVRRKKQASFCFEHQPATVAGGIRAAQIPQIGNRRRK